MEVTSREITVEGLRIHLREAGRGQPLLLLHGWPTSSVLWRNLMEPLAATHRVIAPDLPGFGRSDKPLGIRYGFRFYEGVLEGLCEALEIETLDLVVHDLGGPVGLYWAVQHRERLRRLVLLNTLVYPNPSWAVVLFVLASRVPILNQWMAGPAGIRAGLRMGTEGGASLDEAALAAYGDPFVSKQARRALLAAAQGLGPRGFVHIAAELPKLGVPVRAIYGERDRILPDVAKTMARVARDLPGTDVTSLPGCGHFLQEDRPQELARLLVEFLTAGDGAGEVT